MQQRLREQNSSAIGLTSVLPHADVILPALSACVALALACRRMKTESSVLASCAVAQAYPVLMLIVIHLAMSRGGHRGIIWAVGYACYGLHFIFLWALASHRRLLMGRPAAAAMSAVP